MYYNSWNDNLGTGFRLFLPYLEPEIQAFEKILNLVAFICFIQLWHTSVQYQSVLRVVACGRRLWLVGAVLKVNF